MQTLSVIVTTNRLQWSTNSEILLTSDIDQRTSPLIMQHWNEWIFEPPAYGNNEQHSMAQKEAVISYIE